MLRPHLSSKFGANTILVMLLINKPATNIHVSQLYSVNSDNNIIQSFSCIEKLFAASASQHRNQKSVECN